MSDAAAAERVRHLDEKAEARRGPALRPKDAATLVIIDRAGTEPRVLMGRRHPGHSFMPGLFVFPGGRVEPGDRAMCVTGALDPRCEQRLMLKVQRPSMMRARALALAAIRETFEETGLLFGSAEFGAPESPPPGPWTDFASRGVYPDLSALTFIARAITPPGRPRRFDARFFAVDYQNLAARVEGVVGPDAELDRLVWLTFPETRAFALPPITRIVLDELQERIARGFSPFLPAPFYHQHRKIWTRVEL